MKTLPKTLHIVGRVWIWLVVSWIMLSYFLNLIFSDDPITTRILVFINFWYILFAILIILPGHILTEASEKIANRYGDSFEKTIDGNQSKIISYFSRFFKSKIFLSLAIVGYLILMAFFVLSHNG